MDLNDKVAVVTGASSGIGKSIAEELSKKGCKVALASRSLDKLKEIGKGLSDSFEVEMDVTSNESVTNAFEKIYDRFGQIDILVNCAGVMPLTYLKNRKLEDWLQTIEIKHGQQQSVPQQILHQNNNNQVLKSNQP